MLDGRARLTISRLRRLRNERISSFLDGVMCVQREDVDSTMLSHSRRAVMGSLDRRWLKNDLMAALSRSTWPAGGSGMRRTSRPVDGYYC